MHLLPCGKTHSKLVCPFPVDVLLGLRADPLSSISLKFTFTGDHHDKAFEYLDDLGLKELARREDVHQLGRSIREYLIGPFAKYLPGMVEEWRRTRRRR